MSSFSPVTTTKIIIFFFTFDINLVTILQGVQKKKKRVLLNHVALVLQMNVALLVIMPCVKKLCFEDIEFFSLQSYNPVLAVELLLCLHWCWWFTINGSIRTWVDSGEEMATQSMWLVKQSQTLCSRNPSPTKIDLSMEKAGFSSLSCYVQSDSARYQGTVLGYIQLWWASVVFFSLLKK